MSGAAGGFVSAGLGAMIALALAGATAVAGFRALRRGPKAYLTASVRGTLWRMAGTLVGVAAVLLLGPPSVPAFVVAFLVVYLAAHVILALRFGAVLARQGGPRKEGMGRDGSGAR